MAQEEISFDEFQKLDLRVGQILEAERVEKSSKLLKLRVDLGETRQILAGIALYYSPDELIGRKVAVVANLKPRKMMGLESQGMLLCSSDDRGQLELVNPGFAIPVGGRIS